MANNGEDIKYEDLFNIQVLEYNSKYYINTKDGDTIVLYKAKTSMDGTNHFVSQEEIIDLFGNECVETGEKNGY